MKLSVIIVNYNVKFFLEQCLLSVRKAINGIDAEIIVVDNNSVDGSVKMLKDKFQDIVLIENKENSGFSKANNQAIVIAKGKYILLLNPDTVVEFDTFKKVINFADNTPDAGGIGVKMIDGRGKFLPESKRGLPTPQVAFYKIFGLAKLFPKSKKFGKYHLSYLPQDETHKVDILSGAFMFLRKSVLDKIGYLDETFFMYGEDIDLSYRILKAGYNNYYFPETRIIHYKGESTKKSSVNYVFVFYNAMIIFAQKHFSKKNAKFFSLLINFAIYLRAGIAIINRFLKKMFLPLCDAILVFFGILSIINLWQYSIISHDFDYYPSTFITFVVPAYILIWLFSVYFNGGYERPVSISKTIQGIIIGTFAILVIYALLPETWRFSRAIILLGSLWAIISMILIRYIFHHSGLKGYKIGAPTKRIAIIGSREESERTSLLLNQFSNMPDFIGFVSYSGNEQNAIGHFDQLKDIIEIFKINELIFCAKDIPNDKIIDKMSELNDNDINFKIIPPESLFIVGSNSIEASDSFFTISINAINKAANLRKKYTSDFIIALFMLPLAPIIAIFIKNKVGFLKNLFAVLLFKKTWIGYTSPDIAKKMPRIKDGVFSPLDAFKTESFNAEMTEKINLMYARNYKLTNDLIIILKNLNKLGKKR